MRRYLLGVQLDFLVSATVRFDNELAAATTATARLSARQKSEGLRPAPVSQAVAPSMNCAMCGEA
jgi:hypothetical protein